MDKYNIFLPHINKAEKFGSCLMILVADWVCKLNQAFNNFWDYFEFLQQHK